ncbi:hypothetical protein GCM10010167_72900 [Paractinoplanes deccanensis]
MLQVDSGRGGIGAPRYGGRLGRRNGKVGALGYAGGLGRRNGKVGALGYAGGLGRRNGKVGALGYAGELGRRNRTQAGRRQGVGLRDRSTGREGRRLEGDVHGFGRGPVGIARTGGGLAGWGRVPRWRAGAAVGGGLVHLVEVVGVPLGEAAQAVGVFAGGLLGRFHFGDVGERGRNGGVGCGRGEAVVAQAGRVQGHGFVGSGGFPRRSVRGGGGRSGPA